MLFFAVNKNELIPSDTKLWMRKTIDQHITEKYGFKIDGDFIYNNAKLHEIFSDIKTRVYSTNTSNPPLEFPLPAHLGISSTRIISIYILFDFNLIHASGVPYIDIYTNISDFVDDEIASNLIRQFIEVNIFNSLIIEWKNKKGILDEE